MNKINVELFNQLIRAIYDLLNIIISIEKLELKCNQASDEYKNLMVKYKMQVTRCKSLFYNGNYSLEYCEYIIESIKNNPRISQIVISRVTSIFKDAIDKLTETEYMELEGNTMHEIQPNDQMKAIAKRIKRYSALLYVDADLQFLKIVARKVASKEIPLEYYINQKLSRLIKSVLLEEYLLTTDLVIDEQTPCVSKDFFDASDDNIKEALKDILHQKTMQGMELTIGQLMDTDKKETNEQDKEWKIKMILVFLESILVMADDSFFPEIEANIGFLSIENPDNKYIKLVIELIDDVKKQKTLKNNHPIE